MAKRIDFFDQKTVIGDKIKVIQRNVAVTGKKVAVRKTILHLAITDLESRDDAYFLPTNKNGLREFLDCI